MKFSRNPLAYAATSLFPVGALMALASTAAAPPAGSVIGNQATASYTDAAGVARTASSNLVQTVIAQVAGVDIEATQSRTITPGATVYFPHTITNTGNGDDSFSLSFVNNTGAFDFANIVIYPDANGDGVPDNFTPITGTPVLGAGGTYNIVIAALVPANATAGQSDNLTITATSAFAPASIDNNTDTATVTNNAVINVTKSESVTSGGPGTTTTITLTYTNTGNAAATNVDLRDALPTGMVYVADSGRWSGTAVALTDPAGGDSAGIDYASSANVVTATIGTIAPGQSGTVSFQAAIAMGTPPNNLNNTASVTYDADGNGVDDVTNQPTNTVVFTVNPTVSVTLSDTGSATDGDGNNNDVVSVATAAQGATVSFDNVLTNTGTGADTFDITLPSNNFPSGTSFTLYRPDGATLMTDSNGNGIPDTGPVAPGGVVHVILKAILPTGAIGGPFSATKRATSAADPAIFNDTTDTLQAITANTVDLTNNSVGGPGAGAYATGGAASTTIALNPGATGSFSLFITNTSGAADTYNLSASTDETFATLALPAGWSVVFRRASDGAVITNTGSLAAGGSIEVKAEVSIPANATPTTQNLFFRAASPVSGATDRKKDAVTVNTVHDLSIVPNNVGQTFPGGSQIYPHTLSNQGNVTETASALATANSLPGWTSVIYWDQNGNGTIDPTDPIVDNVNDFPGGIAPGASVNLLVQVYAPLGSVAGQANLTTVSVDTVVGETDTADNSANDSTSVVTGDVQLSKFQALDTGCTGMGLSFTQATINSANAVPGACIRYRINVTNSGGTAATGLVVRDTTPPLTTFHTCGTACPANGATIIVTPASGSPGDVVFTVGNMTAGSAAQLEFSVRINQ